MENNQTNIYNQRLQYLNRLIAQAISSLTASLKFKGALLSKINEFQSNLVPYPKIHFMVCSYSPFVQNKTNVIAKCDPTNGKYIACSLLSRGDILPKDISAAISTIKKKQKIQFVDWCQTGFKVGINYQQQYNLFGGDLDSFTKSVYMISNSTVMATDFSRINRQYDLMFAKRTYEGMEEAQFEQARENLESLLIYYKEVEGNDEKNEEAAA